MDKKIKNRIKLNIILKYILVFILGSFLGVILMFGLNKLFINNVCNSNNESSANKTPNVSYKLNDYSSYNLKEDDHYYYVTYGSSDYISYTLFGDEMKSCTVKLNTERMNFLYRYWGVNLNSSEKYISIDIKFNIPVRSIINGGRGQSVGEDDAMLFLMQDGTVRYLNIVDALTSSEFTANYNSLPTPKTIEGLDHVIAIYTGSYRYLSPGVTGGAVETVAVRDDGIIIKVLDYAI